MTGKDGGCRSRDLGKDNDSRWKTGGGRKHIFDLHNSLMKGSDTCLYKNLCKNRKIIPERMKTYNVKYINKDYSFVNSVFFH